MFDLVRIIFTPGNFTPHSQHFADRWEAMWLIVVGHALSVLAYTLIPITILYVVRKRKDLVYNWMFLLFGAFIVLCGLTHALHIMIFWYPAYYFEVITLVVSFATFLMFLYIIPRVVKLTSPQQLADVNVALAREVERRQQTRASLERRVRDIDSAGKEILGKIDELKKMNALMAGRESKLAVLR